MLRHLFGRNHSHKDSYCPICGGKHAFTTDDFEEELKPFHTHILKKQEEKRAALERLRVGGEPNTALVLFSFGY